MVVSKKNRELIFIKYNGKCAYCGTDLVKGWNVDHIKPQIFGGTNDLDNLNPSCKDCNNYKCHTDLEGYRNQLNKMLNEKLEYLFKSKTKMQVAMNMGSIKHNFWDGLFYFERVDSSSLTPFGESIKLLRDLADLQNGAPLEQHRQEWEETMEQVYDFLNKLEGQ